MRRVVRDAWAAVIAASLRARLPRVSHALAHACVCLAVLCSWSLPGALNETKRTRARARVSSFDETEADAALQRAAVKALGKREGVVLVLDAQTGRLRALAGARLAFEETFAPGSTIKPFTTLAALRAGLLDTDSSLSCRQPYKRDGFEISCTHPSHTPPFDTAQALAYSCNYFYSKLGEQLSPETFNPVLAAFGFGTRTGGQTREAAGLLPRAGEWRVACALGESRQLLVTPAQLVAAYAALFNGGHLYVPRRAAALDFAPRERAALNIAPEHRRLLLEGMRGAIAYGTAARSGLSALPLYIFGKTGTSTPPDDIHSQGWFVGFASEETSVTSETSPASHLDKTSPAAVRLAVLVFLKRAHGSECAEAARPIFREYARLEAARLSALESSRSEDDEDEQAEDESQSDPDSVHDSSQASTAHVRVRLAREAKTLRLSLEDYVFGVLAAEGSVEDELEALKAQAVVSRTYALRHLNRHARDGYDLCNSTHCQRFVPVRDESARPDFYSLLSRAVEETAGQTLRDRQGHVAESYFSASCGGATANLASLWGVKAPPQLRGGRDEFCAGTTETWTDAIPRAELQRALSADERTDTGARLDGVRIARRDASGRAEWVVVEGERRRMVRGWDFKIIVGRTLGWNVLKSSRFDVSRAGGSFIFRGTGFGHGLGLCQAGAHVLARRGASFRQILERYLPGTSISRIEPQKDAKSARRAHGSSFPEDGADSRDVRATQEMPEPQKMLEATAFRTVAFSDDAEISLTNAARSFRATRDGVSFAATDDARSFALTNAAGSFAVRASAARLALSSENFRASYPARMGRREVERALSILESARADAQRRLSAASLDFDGLGTIELFVHETTGDFVGATGQPAWVAAATRGRRIHSQPLALLARRRILDNTMRHEYAHAVVEALARGRAPRWLAEGLAAHFAGESAMLSPHRPARPLTVEELERRLSQTQSSSQETRTLYAEAHRHVAALIRTDGEPSLWQRVAGK